jgi:hypothetical protein
MSWNGPPAGRAFVVAVVVALATVGAVGGRASVAGVAACPRPDDATALPRIGRAFAGDLDGDGDSERVSVVAERRAPGRCGIFLLARDGGSALAVRLPPAGPGSAAATLRRGLPRVVGLFRIDRSRRRDVVVRVDHGPGFAEYALYRVRDGRLVRPRIEGVPRNRLRWSRRAPLRAVFDCDRRPGAGRLLRLEAEREPSGFWDFRRTTLASRGTVFAAIGGFGVVVDAAEAAARFASWPTRPLASCG